MSFTQQQIEAIKAARTEAITNCNASGETFYPDPENSNLGTIQKLLLDEGVPQTTWDNPRVWELAIVRAKAENLLIKRPTPQELERIRERENRAPGRQKYQKDGEREPARTTFDYLNDVKQKWTNRFNQTSTAAPAPVVPKVQWPTFIPYEQMDAENKKLFRALSADQIREFNKKVAVLEHKKKFPDAYDGTSLFGSGK